jgi:HD superfamily phosphohydrolase
VSSSRLPSAPAAVQEHYRGVALFADPIHEYILFTVPRVGKAGKSEVTEKDLIDSPWLQRLRYIYQLQSARWVFPAAEHSRFQHSLGAMHVAGRFARQLYPSLRAVEPTCPSLPYVEAVLRVSALLHDVGHGPFCHFFDHNHLAQYGISHEVVGYRIITQELAELIRGLRRSPSGTFAAGEELEPRHVAYLMQKKQPSSVDMPRWLRLLKPVLSGMYTADNLDYVLRDAYMGGIAIGPVDLERLLHYSFVTERGLALHKAGIGALTMFLNARLYLYTHVYFHRTTRAIDLHLREIFPATMQYIFPGNPLDSLRQYLRLTDWSLMETVRYWEEDALPAKRWLGTEWAAILSRHVKWKMAYDTILSGRALERHPLDDVEPNRLLASLRRVLPSTLDTLPVQLDVATQDPHNTDSLALGERPVSIYDPATGDVRPELLEELLTFIPAKVVQCRVYTTEPAYAEQVARASRQVFESLPTRREDSVDTYGILSSGIRKH